MASAVVSASQAKAAPVVQKVDSEGSLTSWGMTGKVITLKAASLLLDPPCKVRQYYYSFYTLDKTCKTTAQKVGRVVLLVLGIIVFALLTPITAPLGLGLRGLVVLCESKPFVYLKKEKTGKVLPAGKTISIESHNQCYMPAGYSITDGQVTPPSDKARIDENIRKTKEKNPDIACFFEVEDIWTADYISKQFPEYPFVVPVAGTSVIGPTSMIYAMSKFEIIEKSIQFTSFVKGKVPFKDGAEVTGRARFSNKGYLSFQINTHQNDCSAVTVFATHLQHSEIPEKPEKYEEDSRWAQMKRIGKDIKEKVDQGHSVIFTGDMNAPEEEQEKCCKRLKQEVSLDLRRDPTVKGKPTWGGDAWCAKLMRKPASKPLALDHTYIAGKAQSISTQVGGSEGYSSDAFGGDSDHFRLNSAVVLG